MHLQILARIAHAQKGTRDASSNSCAHRACIKRRARCTCKCVHRTYPKRLARCTFKFVRASRIPKKAYAMHYHFRARIAHVEKGTRDAPSISRAHRACPKMHARCTFKFLRASRMPKKAHAMHLHIRTRASRMPKKARAMHLQIRARIAHA